MKVVVVTTSYPRDEWEVAGVFVRDGVDALRAEGVEVDVVWLRHGLQGVALVAWLRPALFAAALAQIVWAGLLQAVAARGLAAVAAVFPHVVLEGVHPCLAVEDEGSQPPHHGQYGFFALYVGGMDIFWGR